MKRGGLEARLRQIATLHGVQVLVGIQGETAPGAASLPELVEIATRHEFGVGVPMRPFLRTSLHLKGQVWARGLKAAVRLKVRGKDPTRTIRRVGLVAVGDVQATIRDYPWAPNSPATIAAKGSDRPLIDSGQLRQSIRAAVETPGHAPELVG